MYYNITYRKSARNKEDSTIQCQYVGHKFILFRTSQNLCTYSTDSVKGEDVVRVAN